MIEPRAGTPPLPPGPGPGGVSTSLALETAAFLQRRLRLSALVIVVVAGLMYVLPATLQAVFGGAELGLLIPDSAIDALHLGIWAVILACYVALLRPGLTLPTLLAGDVLIFLISTGTSVLLGLLFIWPVFPFCFAVLVLLIISRAVFVPSDWRRTLLLSLLPALGLLAPLLHHLGEVRRGTVVADATFELVNVLLYEALALISVGIATFASHVTFSLRREIHEAKRLGPYELEEKIGEGAMGEVYRATHALLKRPTAVKLLRPEITGRESLERFEREVRETSRLTHPNTISVFDFGQTAEGIFYYAMELLDGVDLDRALELSGPMPPSRVIHVLEQVCGALDEAHHLGLIHRDIKPGNIVLCRRGRELDVVKVLDFGLVKDLSSLAPSLTRTGVFVGTPTTGAPEMFFGEGGGPPADLYSLGVVGYKLLTGKPLFDAANVGELIRHHLNTVPVPPSRIDPAVPADLEAVILACLNKEPGDRPATAAALRRMLLDCADAGRWTARDARRWWEARVPASGTGRDG